MDINIDESAGMTIFGCVFLITVAVIVIFSQFYYRSVNDHVVAAIKAGASPIEASIAMDNIRSNDAAIGLLGTRK
jgi:hypothetical protein